MDDPVTIFAPDLSDEAVAAMLVMSPLQWAQIALMAYSDPEPSQ